MCIRDRDQTGTIEIGKDADLVIWSKNPFSVYALAEYVFIDGAEAFVRGEKQTQPVTDFDLGIINPSDERASL